MSKSVFETLSSINVNDKVEQKDKLTYLPWAWAWAEVKKAYPSATYGIYKHLETGQPYIEDKNLGYMCSTYVNIEGETLEMWLPVMNGANKAMKSEPYTFQTRYGDKQVEAATMFDINKTIMRCLVKNLAMFGLGHYIYAGDDLPESADTAATANKGATPDKTPTNITLDIGDDNWDKVLKYVVANKSQGLEVIVGTLSKKYKVTSEVKTELKKSL
jgi:hypothetical protein